MILATHGNDGCAETCYASEILRVWPPDAGATDEKKSSRYLRVSVLGPGKKWSKEENLPANGHLQLAYIFACDAGKKAREWQEHLAPAQVITYNRASTVLDHAFWFAFTGPGELKKTALNHGKAHEVNCQGLTTPKSTPEEGLIAPRPFRVAVIVIQPLQQLLATTLRFMPGKNTNDRNTRK